MKTKKLLSILLTFAMIVGLLPWAATGARAADSVTSTTTDWHDSLEVTGNVTINGKVTLSGDTTLLISNQNGLTVNNTIDLNGHKLEVKGDRSQFGTFTANKLTAKGELSLLSNASLSVTNDITLAGETVLNMSRNSSFSAATLNLEGYKLTVSPAGTDNNSKFTVTNVNANGELSISDYTYCRDLLNITGNITLTGDTVFDLSFRSILEVDTIDLGGHKLTINGNLNNGVGEPSKTSVTAKELKNLNGDALYLNNYAILNVTDPITLTNDVTLTLNSNASMNAPKIDTGANTLTVVGSKNTNSMLSVGTFTGKLATSENGFALIRGTDNWALSLGGDATFTLASGSALLISSSYIESNAQGINTGSYTLTLNGPSGDGKQGKLVVSGISGKLTTNGNVRFDNSVKLLGDTTLTLNENSKLSSSALSPNGHKLTVSNSGELTVSGSNNGTAGGTVVINGGKFSSTGTFGGEGVDITINGATVNATKAGISGNITINSAVVEAKTISGTLTIADATTIKADQYDCTVTAAEGSFFQDDTGNIYMGTLDSGSIAGKTLSPATNVHSITVDKTIKNGSVTVSPAGGAASGRTVTVTVRPNAKYTIDTVKLNGNAIEPTDGVYSFTMPNENVALTATFKAKSADVLPGSGTEGDPYLINNETDWNEFCHLVEDYGGESRFEGYVKLCEDIAIHRSAGSEGHEFCGVFDGGGKKITNDIYAVTTEAKRDAAVFSRVGCEGHEEARIFDLTVDAYSNYSYANAALISTQAGIATIRNCRVTPVFHYNGGSDIIRGGFVSVNSGTISFIGCVFDGAFTSAVNCTIGGFVGSNSGTVNITDSLMRPSYVSGYTTRQSSLDYHDADNKATFCNGGTLKITNSFYTLPFGNGEKAAQGTLAHTIKSDDYTEVGFSGDAVKSYSVSDISFYSAGIAHDGALLAAKDDVVALTLNCSDNRTGYKFDGSYTASAGTLNGTSLTMPDADVTVSASFLEIVETPYFTPDSNSSVIEGDTVRLNCYTTGATIYYSVNDGAYAEYKEPFTISKDSVVKAYAVKEGMADSAVAEAQFYFEGATYDLAIGDITFSDVPAGYDQPRVKHFRITNSGNSCATISSVTLGGKNPDAFTLGEGTTSVYTHVANESYTVRPRTGLAAGTYTAKVTVTYNGGKTAEANVSFKVISRVEEPVFSPVEGRYIGTQTVELSCKTAGAEIYYTTDSKIPTRDSTRYTGAITVSSTTFIMAIAVKSGMWDSTVANATFTIIEPIYDLSVEAPEFDDVAPGYTQPTAKALIIENKGNSDATISSVTVSGSDFKLNRESGATIETGKTDSTTYTIQPKPGLAAGTHTDTITVTYNNGNTATAEVSFTVLANTAAPEFTPAAGDYIGTQNVKITSATTGAVIYYTTNGSEPTTGSKRYTGEITVSESQTIRAIAVKDGMATTGSSAEYNITPADCTPEVAAPSFADAAPGYDRPDAKTITITNKGNVPLVITKVYLWSTSYFELNKNNGLTLAPGASDTSYTVRPKAGLGTGTYSTMLNVEYQNAENKTKTEGAKVEVSFTVMDTVAMPGFSLLQDSYIGTQSVELTCATPGAAIYYTTNGSDPTTDSTRYTGAITVDRNMTIKAFAAAEGYAASGINTATYFITPLSGKDGDITWKLTKNNDGSYALSITGKNTAMPDYVNGKTAPWSENDSLEEKITSVTLSAVTTVGAGAFAGCRALKSATLCDGIKTIGECAFRGCEALESMPRCDGLTAIGERAFEHCAALGSAALGEGLLSVGNNAFSCTSIKTAAIPASVTELAASAFADCTALTSITVAGGSKSYSVVDGVLYKLNEKGEPVTLMCCPLTKTGSITVPGTVTSFEQFAFYGSSSNTYTKLSEIKLAARTETLSFGTYADGVYSGYADVFGNNYEGDCVISVPDGMLMSTGYFYFMRSEKVELCLFDGDFSFHAVTAWDGLQDQLFMGGTVKLDRDYDYNSDSFEYSVDMLVMDGNGHCVCDEEGEPLTEPTDMPYGILFITEDTVLDLNGKTLNVSVLRITEDVKSLTIKNGTLKGAIYYDSFDGSGGMFGRKANRRSGDINISFAGLTLENAEVTLSLGELLGSDDFFAAFSWSGGVELINSTLDVDYGMNVWIAPPDGAMLTMDADSSVTFRKICLKEIAEKYKASIMGKVKTEEHKEVFEQLFELKMIFFSLDLHYVDEYTSEQLNALYREQLGAFIPDGYRLDVIKLNELVEEDDDDAELDALIFFSVKDANGEEPESVTLRANSVKGSFNSKGELVAAVARPADGKLLVAAEYDASGKLTNIKTIAVEAGKTSYKTGLTRRSGYTCKLMLVDKNYVPLCEAWANP